MGVGDPLQAAYRLSGPIPSGTWKLIGDGLIFESCDVHFDLVWHTAATETTLASFEHHFDAPPAGPDRFSAVPFEGDAPGAAANAAAGDQLLLRFSITSTHAPGTRQYAPNGDGLGAKGRIPSLRPPR